MASILDLVKHYQHAIEKYPNDEQKILKCIDKLFNLGVTVQHLQETGVGRTVNALRKEPGDVGQAARALVNKWKLMVAAEESDHDEDQPQSATYNGYDNGKTPEDIDYDSKVKTNQYDKYSKNNTEEEKYSQHMNGNYSGKRKYHSSEDEEPHVKKSKNVTYDEVQKSRSKLEIQVKKEQSETEHESHSTSSHSEGSDSEESESCEEDKYSKQSSRTKNSDKHQSSSTKYSSNDSRGNHNKSSSSSGKSHENERRHTKHSHVESKSTSEKSSKDKSSSSDKYKKDTESSKKEKSEHKSSDKEKKRSEAKKENSSDRHRSSSEKHKSGSHSEKHKSNSEKSSNKSEKHSSSQKEHKSEKEKHKHSSEKSSDKHKSKEHSSNNKDKHSSSSKEKEKDKKSSSKDKENSNKSDKKHSSSDVSIKENRSKSEKHDRIRTSSSSNNKEKKSHSSSHSSKSSKSSSSKSKDIPKKKQKKDNGDSEDGIDCGSGASFAEALGMISPSKPKKKSSLIKETSHSPNNSSSHEDLSPATLLAPTAKLAPLPALEISALPEISPNYKPRPPPRFLPHFTDEDALSAGISSKNQRTKVYSGNKVLGKIPTLYEMCVLILQEHIDALEYTGGVPYEILKPVVDKATPQQLYMLEHFNPYLMEDTDHLWQKFCEKNFRNKKRQELESWREMYIRCQEEQEHKLKSLTANIRIAQEAKKAPVKQTKMAYVDTVVKPPRNIARKQAQHGTAFAASASPAARVAALAAAPNVLKGSARPAPVPSATSSAFQKPKKAPLMQKALQFMRGRKR